MLFKNKTDYLMESIREGRAMARSEKLNLIVGLSIPSMLAQISTVMMFFIDASMVGHLGAEASASIGLIESTNCSLAVCSVRQLPVSRCRWLISSEPTIS